LSPSSKGLVQSLQARLLNEARALDADPNSVLARFGIERFLLRLARSRHVDRFILKGGMLLRVWLGETSRPTRDADLLGFGQLSLDALRDVFREICTVEVEPDGVSFLPESVRVAPIRVEDQYGGNRVTLKGLLGTARLAVQIDVGIGDIVTPEPEWIDYPSLLDLPRPHLRAYRPETTIAEKTHAMATYGMANTRMRDFLDIYDLSRVREFDGAVLAKAIKETFARRRTSIGAEPPVALTMTFGADTEKQTQWRGFLRKDRLADAPQQLSVVVVAIAGMILPIWAALRTEKSFGGHWPPGGPWRVTP
jgi:hypothetical protein